MSTLARLLHLSPPPASLALERACRDVEAAQRDCLLALVRDHRRTAFGRQHGYSTIRSVDDFRQRVNVAGYDAFTPFVDAMLHGDADALVPGRPEFFCATAGTTGLRKLLPVTPRWLAAMEGLLGAWLEGVRAAHPGVQQGRGVFLGATANVDVAPGGTPIGNLSGFLARRLEKPLQQFNALPLDVLEIHDPELRAYVTVRATLGAPVTWLAGLDSLALRGLFHVLETRADALLRDLQDGTLSAPVPRAALRRLQPLLRRQPGAARQASARARMAGKLTPRAAWPDLRLLTCWTHGAGAEFLPEIAAAAPGVPVWAPHHAAAEAWVTVPREGGMAPQVLAAHAGFFEFIPVDDAGEPVGEPLLAHEVAHQGRYGLVVTTRAGVARYRLGDIVEVDGFHHRAPRLRFLERTAARLSLAGERTTEGQAQAAIAAASRAEAVPVAHWALAVSPSRGPAGRPRYTFLVEPPAHARPAPDAEARLARALDGALQQASRGYAAARAQGALDPCTLSHVAPGRTLRAHTERSRRGHAGDQTKTVRVLRDAAERDLYCAAYEREP